MEAVESLSVEPLPMGYKKLVGSEHVYRICVGSFRIIYEFQNTHWVVLIIKVKHRKDVYR